MPGKKSITVGLNGLKISLESFSIVDYPGPAVSCIDVKNVEIKIKNVKKR